MSYETIPVEMKDSGTVHVLVGTINDIKPDLSEADVEFDDYGLIESIPIFYHCENEETASKESGEEKIPFTKNDEVIVVNSGSIESLSASDMKIVGFADGVLRGCWVERVYVSMKSSLVDIKRCFVWDIKENTYAIIPDNEGNPVIFPCDPADISDWYDEQESVEESLLSVSHCGVSESSFNLGCDKENPSLLKEEPSDCDSDFMNTGSCTFSGGDLYVCRWEDVPPWDPRYPGYYEKAFDQVRTSNKHILWGTWFGYNYVGSEKITFRNNCSTESTFKAELSSEYVSTEHGMEDIQCGGLACDNWTINRETNQTWEFGSPIESLMYTLDSESTQSGNLCGNTGQTQDTDVLVTWAREFKPSPVELKPYGVYSDKNIAQIYFVEIQTRSRNAACCVVWGSCVGSGCVGGFHCPWETEEYTFQGLKLVAQVDTLTGTEYPDGTEGVDPTTLPRNEDLETAVSGLYDVLRADIFEATTGWEEGDVLGAYLNQFLILKGVADL